MNTCAQESRLGNVLRNQIDLLERYCQEEREMRQHLLDRSWPELERVLGRMDGLSRELSDAEEERLEAFEELRRELGAGEEDNFYHVIAHLPADERADYAQLYRRLKMCIVSIRSVTAGIDSYATEKAATLHGVLRELFPHRKGKIYSRNGAPRRQDDNPVVLDHHR
jgi:hypothetical protein